MARGLSNADLGRELVLEASTVKKHVANVLSKLDLRSRAQAVVFAYEHGLARPGGSAWATSRRRCADPRVADGRADVSSPACLRWRGGRRTCRRWS